MKSAPLPDEPRTPAAYDAEVRESERRAQDEKLRNSEQQLRLALEAGRMGAWEWDIAGNRVHWSPGLEALHGLAPGSFDGTFESFRRDIHPDDLAEVERRIAHTLESGEEHRIEYRIVLEGGATKWVEGRGRLFRDASGRAQRMVGVCADITERRRAELAREETAAALALEREALREADRRKDEFIAMLSHELRNPLAPLRSALELMRLQEVPGADARVRAMMERQVAHLTRLVDDLLEASRISRGLLELKRAPLELAEVLRAAVESAEPLIREAGHRLELELPPGPLPIEADAVRLAQAFANLLNNAARYTPRGGRIWLRASRADGARALVSVRDDGAGFAPAMGPRLFEMFWRGPGSSGLGIGLALTRKLVEMHGGAIEARSEGEGRGAEFEVSLPLQAAPARAAGEASTAMPNGLRVLVADDNRDAAETLGALLRALGNEVSLAYDGVEAVAAARATRPHVILLDIGMPRLDGYAAARELRQDAATRGIRLVALTGWGQEEDRRRAREAGFDAHLVKPAELDALRRVLDQVKNEPGR